MEKTKQEQTVSGTRAAGIDKLNDYEKVILAAKLARKINNQRVVAREQMAPEEIARIDQRKVTSVALEDLEMGKIHIVRQKETPEEETFDLT
jgi:DNA-directed RNA polymerase subunit K/omega